MNDQSLKNVFVPKTYKFHGLKLSDSPIKGCGAVGVAGVAVGAAGAPSEAQLQ